MTYEYEDQAIKINGHTLYKTQKYTERTKLFYTELPNKTATIGNAVLVIGDMNCLNIGQLFEILIF